MEAAEGRKRLLANQGSSTAPIHEDAWQREILYIYNTAQPQTLAVYQFGHDTVDPDRPDNWIIRWMLWHVFRYRDYRNKQNRLKDAPSDDDDESERSSAKGSRRSSNDAAASAGPSNAPKGEENAFRNHGHHANMYAPAQASPTPPRTYWDPVREQ
jgi:hypothetical protein